MKFFLLKFLKYFFVPLLLIALLWVFYFLIYANFHKVDKGFYRSAQLFSLNMPFYVEKYQIKSILNFRGESSASWYKNEIAYAKENNLSHYNYAIGDRREIKIEQMEEMVRLMKEAPKPLLIHCKAGADRTSLAAALYLHAVKNDHDADREISLLYGHFPWLGSKTYFMDQSFENYRKLYPIE